MIGRKSDQRRNRIRRHDRRSGREGGDDGLVGVDSEDAGVHAGAVAAPTDEDRAGVGARDERHRRALIERRGARPGAGDSCRRREDRACARSSGRGRDQMLRAREIRCGEGARSSRHDASGSPGARPRPSGEDGVRVGDRAERHMGPLRELRAAGGAADDAGGGRKDRSRPGVRGCNAGRRAGEQGGHGMRLVHIDDAGPRPRASSGPTGERRPGLGGGGEGHRGSDRELRGAQTAAVDTCGSRYHCALPGDDAASLGGEELLPCRAGPSRCGVDPGVVQDLPYRAGGDGVAKADQFAVHAAVPPQAPPQVVRAAPCSGTATTLTAVPRA